MKKLSRNIWGTILRIVLLLVTMVTLTLFTSIYPITIPWKPVFASPDTLAYYPSNYNLLGSTKLVSGSLTDLQSDNVIYMQFRSYVSSSSTTAKTNAFIAYRDSTTSLNTPKERTWTGDNATWGLQSAMPAAGSPVRWVRVAYCPIEQRSFEKIVVTLSDAYYLDAYVWDGTSWTVTNNIGYVGSGPSNQKCFDVAYEKTSGRALLVYSRGTTTNEIGYKIWTFGTGWSSENLLDCTYTAGQVYLLSLASKPTSGANEIAMIYADYSRYLQGYVWTGSSWSLMGATSVWDNTIGTYLEEDIAVAYEQQSGRAMFIWGAKASGDNNYRIWDGSTLGATTILTISAQGQSSDWVTLKANPASNELMYLVVDGARDLNTAYWSGSAWTVATEHDDTVDSHSERCADFAWEPTGSKGLLVWGTTAGQIAYQTFTASDTWGTQQNPTMGANEHPWVQLRTNPRSVTGDVKILGAVLEGTVFDLGAISWSGSAFSVIGTNTISSDTNVITYECFDLKFQKFGPPSEFTSEVEFTGTSNTQSLTQLVWTVDSSFTTTSVTITLQLYNWNTGYPASGDGYLTDTIGTSDVTKNQTITTNPTYFKDASGNWKMKIKGVKLTSTQFDWKGDLVKYEITWNYVPTNDALTLDLTGASYKGTKTLLAAKQDYKFVHQCTDADGVTDITYAEIRLDYATKNVILRATRGSGDTWTFAENSDPSNYVTLNVSACTHSTSGNQKTFNYYVTINWNWDDASETLGVRCYVIDSGSLSDTDDYTPIFGVENDLSSSSLAVNDYRCNPSQTLTFSGYWYYEGTSIYPPDGNYNVLIKLSGVQKGSADTTLVSGAFSISDVTAETGIASYSYTCEATYMSGAGSFSAVIVDRIKVNSITNNDARRDVSTTATLTVNLIYEYDSTAVTTFSGTLNSLTLSGGAGGSYTTTDTSSTVQQKTYNSVSGSETTYGLNTVNMNSQSTAVIWDRIKINTGTLAFSDADGRVDVGTSATFYCTAQSEYTDNHALGSGDSLVLSGYTFTWSVANNRWEYTSTQGSVTTITINSLTSVNEATYGITVGNINSNSATGTWDRIKITTSSLQAVDGRIDINTQGTFYCQAVLESDNHALGSGDSLTLSGYAFSWFAGNSRFENSTTQGSVTSITINAFTSGNEATYGITVGVINSNTATIIWDRIYDVVPFGSDDTRINVGATATITVTLHYDFDETDVTDGTVTINGVSATHLGSGQWRIQPNGGGVVTGITYNTVACSGNAYGITSVSISSSVTQVWDRIKIDGFGRTDADGRVNVNSAGVFWATASLEYIIGGNHTLGLGDSLTLSGYIFTWNVGNSRFENSTIQASVTSITINSFTSGNETTFSITVGNIDSKTSTIIWDRLQVQSYTVADTRVNVNDYVNIDALVWFDFDNIVCTTGTITINGFSASHQGSGVYRITRTSAVVTNVTYNTVACSAESTYDITTVDQNSQSTTVIWDRIKVYWEQLNDSRVDIGSAIEGRYKAVLDYDDHPLGSNDSMSVSWGSLTWDSENGWWDILHSESVVTGITITGWSGNEVTYGITSITENITETTYIYDRIEIYEKDDPLIVNEIWQTQNLDQQVIPTYVLFYPLLVYAVLLFPAIKNKKKAKAFTFILLLSFLVVIVPNITTVFASDETVTVNTYVIIWFRARYDYDKVTYSDSSGSTLSINATSTTYNSTTGALYWYRNVTQSTPGEYVYTVTAISDGVYGLTTFNNIIGYITITFTDPPPTYSNVGTNSTLAGQPCEFYTLWNDNTNVSGFIFGTNNTGSWTNETWVAFSVFYNSTAAWSNVTKTLNSTIDVVIQWQIWCNDTGNNWNNTGIQTFATTLAYKLNLMVMDWDLTDAIANAYVTMNNETDYVQVSDSNGWANYTGLSGTVTVKVQYFGFWVNGTFSVTMDSDKTINVQCKLYDVTVLVQESVQNAYLASANVTVYNSTSVQGNKITSGVTGNNGQVQLLNLPNNTLTFTQYGGASYSLVIGNTTPPLLVSSENQTITLTADQNNVNTNNNYSIIAFAGMTIPFKSSFVTKRLKKKMQKKKRNK